MQECNVQVEEEEDFIPRNYQLQLMNIALEKNTILYLPTGSGKTFIAVMLIKKMSQILDKPISQGGRITLFLVSSVALVEQHSKTLRRHTPFNIGEYTGEMNIDSWSNLMWNKEINSNQILVMTSQIAVNIVSSGYLNISDINLLIFDECHHGVNDEPMRQLMKLFEFVTTTPRILGLTATLLNGNVKPTKVLDEVRELEKTFQSKVATIDVLKAVIGFSTNPTESICYFQIYEETNFDKFIFEEIENSINIIKRISKRQEPVTFKNGNYKRLDADKNYKEYVNILKDLLIHFKMLGLFGGSIAILAHLIQLEKNKFHSEDNIEIEIINSILTVFQYVRLLIKKQFKNKSFKEIIQSFSSPKVLMLLSIFAEYKSKSVEPLSALVFTDRRFTAKILSHIMNELKTELDEYKDYNADFMIGFNNNPNDFSTETLFLSKTNKRALQKFENREVNVLFCTNVLEEGIDIRLCSLVIKFDTPLDYRSYIQSKGRARNKDSFFYIMVDQKDAIKFQGRYATYQRIETMLKEFLINEVDEREDLSHEEIKDIFEENALPPYFVDGPGSSQINVLNSVSKLCEYCQCLSSDSYTVFGPEWFIENNNNLNRVHILMPIVCPLIEPIKGTWQHNKKIAKRTAAYMACVALHKHGELNDFLHPVGLKIIEKDTKHFFKHFPEIENADKKRANFRNSYKKSVPKILDHSLFKAKTLYLHVIQLTPLFSGNDTFTSLLIEIVSSDLSYGIITSQPLKNLCSFPIFPSGGEVLVDILCNKKKLELDEEQMILLRRFNYVIFHDILKVVKNFFIFDNSNNVGQFLIVPLIKSKLEIPFEIIQNNEELVDITQKPSVDEILNINEEAYNKKIVSPWYKNEPNKNYIVVQVSDNVNALSPFPTETFVTFSDYFKQKYQISILNEEAKLLHVKALSSALNLLKPRNLGIKRRRDQLKEEICPELCIKQEFPSTLWIQATFLPSIINRFEQLIRADELRSKIASETSLGKIELSDGYSWKRLKCEDNSNINKRYVKDKSTEVDPFDFEKDISEIVNEMKSNLSNVKSDVASKMLNSKYPWLDNEEPVDIYRNLNVTLLEIQHYENFMEKNFIKADANSSSFNFSSSPLLAVTYNENYKFSCINMLTKTPDREGPQLRDVYKALCTTKSSEIVNLERMEILGDSFLKFASTVFIFYRFPKYNEGQATKLKSRIISNRNLLYLGLKKNLESYIKVSDFNPEYEWMPPCFYLPSTILENENISNINITKLTYLKIPKNEIISGIITPETESEIKNHLMQDSAFTNEEVPKELLHPFVNMETISNKTIADCVEAILGVYFHSSGIEAAFKMMEWFEIIPEEEKICGILQTVPPNPLLGGDSTANKIEFHLNKLIIKNVEECLGYTFKNKGFLLQALTHSSYYPNRVTNCYQRLEFLGDAVLDFLITCFIFETCGKLDPGELTDLRSALVNNITFAGISVRVGLHKFLLHSNKRLSAHIDSFVSRQESKDFVIDEQVLILLEERDVGLYLSEHIDVPKVLGDLFESIVGAIFLDSNNCLETTWKFIHRIMWNEISSFTNRVPKNPIRLLYEAERTHPKFYKPINLDGYDKCMMRLDFMAEGKKKTVYGFGENKGFAKRAAAKFALRLLWS